MESSTIIRSAIFVTSLYLQIIYGSSCSNTCSTSCSVNNKNPPTYNADHLGIGNDMNDICLPDDTNIPENDFVCYKHNWCNDGGCKLSERSRAGPTCNWNLITVDESNPAFPIVQMQSPKHSCESNNRYFNKLFCIYNISLPACGDETNTTNDDDDSFNGGVRVTFNDIDIVDGSPSCTDYVQIIHSNGKFEKLCGDNNEQGQFDISSTNFLVAFFSDKTVKAEGFSLKAECRV